MKSDKAGIKKPESPLQIALKWFLFSALLITDWQHTDNIIQKMQYRKLLNA